MNENDIPSKFLWMDLEMTGLSPLQRIIEVAVIVTDSQLHELARYEAIIYQDEEVLANAEDWPKQNMQELLEEVRHSTNTESDVRVEINNLIKRHFGSEKAVLAGNSIHQDRRFIRQWWPDIDSQLHYRMLDVSAFKIWVQTTSKKEFGKAETHRALDDILESIDELKWCLSELKN